MEIVLKLSCSEIGRIQEFVTQQSDNPFVRYRLKKNVEEPPTSVSVDIFWKTLVGCLLTSQQRSGPDSPVSRFLMQKPFPLDYKFCEEQSALACTSETILKDFGGIRFTNRLSKQFQKNHLAMQNGLWVSTESMLDRLVGQDSSSIEREVADLLREHYNGLGPKQSRNLLQGLGLSRYEIPIDSRITKWLNGFGFPLTLSTGALSDPNYYCFVSDGIQDMCRQCEILPCILDAAIFSSYDSGWTDENVLW